MSRRRKDEPQVAGCPAWLATFGDLMNLLLCFFVLLFSMSNVDAQKYELVAASFSQTFSVFKGGGMSIGDGVLIGNGVSQLTQLDQYMNSMGKSAEGSEDPKDALNEVEAKKMQASEELAEKVQESLQEQNIANQVNVDFTSEYVQLTLNGALLFDSGKTELKKEAIPLLTKIGYLLERYAVSVIEVEGHTDNVPIHTEQFGNNDELSSFRALSMFEFLKENTNIDPSRIKHSGRGEYVPIADNTTPEGRAKNRRVEIKIYHTLSSYQ